MLVHECHNSACLFVNNRSAVLVESWGERGLVMVLRCCLVIVVSRAYVRCSSRDVAINTRSAGRCGLATACFHSRPPMPVINSQVTSTTICAMLLPQLLVLISDICPPGPTNSSSLQKLAICCPSCQAAKLSQPFTACRSCPCSAFSSNHSAPPNVSSARQPGPLLRPRPLERRWVYESLPKPVDARL